MTLQDSESVGQSQLRAGWSTRLFSATREGFPLVPALWPVLLSHWPRATEPSRERSRLTNVRCTLCATQVARWCRRSWNTWILSQDRNTTGAAAFTYHTYPFKY